MQFATVRRWLSNSCAVILIYTFCCAGTLAAMVAPDPARQLTKPLRRAYSYLRFSSSEQSRGDSLRRQLELTRRYCAAHSLQLDETLRDEGVSAYRGAHAKAGKLGEFLRLIGLGKIPRGSVLIVESLDRLSREKPFQALKQLIAIIDAGVEVVTLIDEQSYSEAAIEKNPHALMLSIGIMARAHEESATKARRLSERWAEKRNLIGEGRAVRQVLPAWLRYGENGQVESILERVRIIKRIFKLALKGWGKIRICKLLDSENVEPWGVGRRRSAGGWQVSYIVRLLTARTMIGEFQPHKMTNGRRSQRVPVGDPRPNYYPAVIDRQLFDAVQNLRRHDPRGRADCVKNLFTGLCFDGKTGAILHIEHHGRRGGKNNHKKSYLTTARVLRNKHGCITWRYDLFESAFIEFLRDLNLDAVLSPTGHNDELRERLATELAAAEQKVSEISVQIERLVDALAAGESPSVVQRIRVLETERVAATLAAKTAKESFAAEEFRVAHVTESSNKVRLSLQGRQNDPEVRRRMRDEIRRVVERIDLFPKGHVPGEPLKSDEPAFRVKFRSGVSRTLWVKNPPPRSDDAPVLVALAGDGCSCSEWQHALKAAGWEGVWYMPPGFDRW